MNTCLMVLGAWGVASVVLGVLIGKAIAFGMGSDR